MTPTQRRDLVQRLFESALDDVKRRNFEQALGVLTECIKLDPEFYDAWVVRGNILLAQEKNLDALLHYDRAISIKSDLQDVWCNRGQAFAQMAMPDAAIDSFQRAVDLQDYAAPHVGIAEVCSMVMDLDRAEKEYRAALKLDPTPDAAMALGTVLLGRGQWEEGFKCYEQRWQNTPYPPRAYTRFPKWRGEDLNGKTILLYPEQGYGDEIMNMRFATRSHFPGARVVLQVRPPMFALAQSFIGVDLIVSSHDDFKDADYSCPILDVPMMVGATPDDVLCGPYLSPDRELVAQWNERTRDLPGLKVGIVWRSGGHVAKTQATQFAKSIPPQLLPAFKIPGVTLVSLQKPRVPDIPDIGLVDWTDELHDFADTAALIANLDVVVAADTAVAHVAGAIGVPCVNFVRFNGFWPWLAPKTAIDLGYGESWSMWYPNMRLFRQQRISDWIAPVERVVETLKHNAAGR